VAVHASGVYWTSFAGSIGHAALDGSAADREFIPLPSDSHPFGIAVDDEHVYWTRTFSDTIDRAAIDGSGIELGLIELAPHGADYIALDEGHVYWTNNVTDTIGRADLDGTGADEAYIPLPADSHPYGIAVDSSHIYWADIGTSAIGRVGDDGSNLDPRFVDLPLGALPYDVAIDGGSDTRLKGDASAKGVQKQRRQRVRVGVRLKAGEPLSAALRGELKLRGESYELTPKSRELGADAGRSLNLAPRRRQDERTIAESLADGRRATAEVIAKLTDLAINTDSERLRVRLTG
jgi:hypothetical protein